MELRIRTILWEMTSFILAITLLLEENGLFSYIYLIIAILTAITLFIDLITKEEKEVE